MADFGGLLKSGVSALGPDEALRQPVGSLLGVSTAAQTALAPIGIHTIFDLAASRIFATANALLDIQRDFTTAEARLNMVAADAIEAPAGVPVTELADSSIAILRGIGAANAPTLAAALDIEAVRDLALWPPYRAAREVLDFAFSPEKVPGFDSEAPADLLPKSGLYPTERILFRKLVLDAVSEPNQQSRAIEGADPIDLGAALTPVGFQRVAKGALLTFSQSWFAEGLALGQLLHSTALAPGESTRIAMIDWSRRTRAAASEDISEAEQLTNTMTHSRAVSEVTDASAREFQGGGSRTHTTSTTDQAGAALGLEIGPIAFGGSASTASSTTDSWSVSSSFGERELAASYAQQINDRTQQNASSVRNRRASIVREVSQEEHEQISTRVVTNYNHMHALSVQYYEVVQAFRVTSQLDRAERCLFVPLKLISFREQDLIDRWRLVLADAALTSRARRQLTVEYGVVEIIPQTPKVTPGRIIVAGIRGPLVRRRSDAGAAGGGARAATREAIAETAEAPEPPPPPTPSPADYDRAPVNSPAAVLAAKGWNIDQLNAIGWATGRVLMRPDSDSVFISDDALVLGFTLRDGQASRFSVRQRDGSELVAEHSSATAFAFANPVPITDLQSISIHMMSEHELRTSLVLQLNVLGTVIPLDVPVAVRPITALQEVVRFGPVTAARELVDHLEANRLHYSQAIYRTLDSAAIAALLAPYTYRGLPLAQLVDLQPIAVTANFLVFRVSVSAVGRSEDERWAAEESEWRQWLDRHGLSRPAPRSEIVPLPSGGVFAEAVLGRFNSAERIDLQRFWNWQDSPIPITAPEIAPVQAGSRALPEDLLPGQLSQPVVNIQTPTALPDATGVGAILAAIQQGNMFRDMSGLAQTAALAQAALQSGAQGAMSAAQQAGQNMKTVVDANTERMRIAAELAAKMLPETAGNGGGGRSPKNVSEEGARLNYARGLDERNGNETADGEIGAGSEPRVAEMHPQFAAAQETTKPSIERDTFDLMSGGAASNIAKGALGLATHYPSPEGGGGTTSATRKPKAQEFGVRVRLWQSKPNNVPVDQFSGDVKIKAWEGGDSLSDRESEHSLGKRVWAQDWKTIIWHTDLPKRQVVGRVLTFEIEVRVGAADYELNPAGQPPKTYVEDFVVPVPIFPISVSDKRIVVDVTVEEMVHRQRVTASNQDEAVFKAASELQRQGFFTLLGTAETAGDGRFEAQIRYYTGKLRLLSEGRPYSPYPDLKLPETRPEF
jgi:hypothetical protein